MTAKRKRKPSTIAAVYRRSSAWIKGKYRAREDGLLPTTNEEACRFCLVGAVEYAYGAPGTGEVTRAKRSEIHNKLKAAIKKLYPHFIVTGLEEFNDHSKTTFTMIRKVVREAKV